MKNRNAIRILLSANFISGIAQGLSMIAVPLYFAQVGESQLFTTVYMLITLVSLFWAPYAGTIVDRYDRKTIFIYLNIVLGILMGGVAYMEATTENLSSYCAAAAFALTFWNYSLHYPCFYAFMQEISERDYYNKIASSIEIQSQLASALAGAGAALLLKGGDWGGIHLEKWSLAEVFFLDCSTYFVALTLILFLQYQRIGERKIDQGSLRNRLVVGFNFLRQNKYIFYFGLASYSVFMVILLHLFTLAPVYIKQHLQAAEEVYAISEIFYALGAILAGLSIQALFKWSNSIQAIKYLLLLTLGIVLLLFFNTWVWVFYLISLLIGVSNAGVRILRVSYLFKVVPNQVMGRSNSIFSICNTLVRICFLGLFSLPFFHEQGQIIYSYLVLSLVLLLSIVVLQLLFKRFPKVD